MINEYWIGVDTDDGQLNNSLHSGFSLIKTEINKLKENAKWILFSEIKLFSYVKYLNLIMS